MEPPNGCDSGALRWNPKPLRFNMVTESPFVSQPAGRSFQKSLPRKDGVMMTGSRGSGGPHWLPLYGLDHCPGHPNPRSARSGTELDRTDPGVQLALFQGRRRVII